MLNAPPLHGNAKATMWLTAIARRDTEVLTLSQMPHICADSAPVGMPNSTIGYNGVFSLANSVSTKMQMTAIPEHDKLMFMHL